MKNNAKQPALLTRGCRSAGHGSGALGEAAARGAGASRDGHRGSPSAPARGPVLEGASPLGTSQEWGPKSECGSVSPRVAACTLYLEVAAA